MTSALAPSHDDIAALERGSTLLGCGGGGPTPLAASLLRRWTAGKALPRLLDAAELPPDAPVIATGIVGATAALAEKPPGGAEFPAVVEAVAAATRTRPHAVMGIEVGGVNGVMVFAAAAVLGLDVVDADLMGRALPRLDQLASAAAGRPLAPVALAGGSGPTAVFDGIDDRATERLARSFLPEAGGWASVAFAPLRAADIANAAIPGTVRRALHLGRTHLALPVAGDARTAARALGGELLCDGRVLEVVRHRTRRTFAQGTVTVVDDAAGALTRVEMENEYLLALTDGTPVASTPDLICLVDRRTGSPVGCDQVRAGLDIAVLHLPGAAFWRHPDRIGRVGPRAFDLAHPPVLLDRPWTGGSDPADRAGRAAGAAR
ncbi:hypothetical protein CLV63_10173 [Murinocardiopsis flavida]|uniref:DUF917 domain-containing protein n=1 Tax=Murinocardiopsis flavida TaxID=645275 RepID=A0A2P8DTR2_9ACTN|nr:DUF917 domain-containing protein [Murinocardiopsis flavida]PSL00599.1 hypothetical protein CLV63_10173 [Murinocardiopsis flavida]